MSEGWEDWPVLGPGWKRRTVVRKSGASCGQMDTYYQSPSGTRFRSKIELQKYLGGSVDLSLFDFKNGVIIPREQVERSSSVQKNKPKKKKRQSCPSEFGTECHPKKPRASLPLLTFEEPQENGKAEETLVRCQSCQVWFTGVQFGKSKQPVFYCANCRAARRAYNKEQKHYKTVGCGTCAACKVPENCGYCTVCLLRSHNPEFGSSWKCVRRRCLQVIRKGSGCCSCQGCNTMEDCLECSACIQRLQSPEDAKEKCLKRRCVKKNVIKQPESQAFGVKKLKLQVKPLSERDTSCLTSKQKKKHPCVNKVKLKTNQKSSRQKLSVRRTNRKCGECEACLQKVDCGKCDFCQDKPKFGGRNLKRQKCRWRQCLRFAMEKNIPAFHRSSNHPVLLERIKKEKVDAEEEYIESQQQDLQSLSTLRVPVIKLERLKQRNGLCPDEHNNQLQVINPSGMIKQEEEEPSMTCEEQVQPLNLHHTVKIEEFISESDDIAEPDESTPVIMEIFSLGDYHTMHRLDGVLEEFVNELNEIPLPAHWEVQASSSPDLQLVQRSRLSTMADTVIHIQPGLLFHVVVRGQPVPSFHELYTNHPSRLTTVDEVVELICDLEAYRPCAGIPRIGQCSPECRVLVYEERCPVCCTAPWPSGSGL